MVRRAFGWLCLCALLAAAPAGASAQTRVALVIGNSTYDNVERLTNPATDAAALAETLEAIGFDKVELALDLDYSAMRRALADFARTAAGADIAIVYFAGHGIEVGGTNYLIPTDATLDHADDVEFEAMSLDTAMHAVGRAGRLKLVILDACRNNPFTREMEVAGATRSVGRGLARVEPQGSDTLVAYAAREGTVAADGTGANSPFAAALIRHIATPDLDVRLLFGRVRDDVRAATGGQQEPFTYGSLGGEQIYLAAASPGTSPGSSAPRSEIGQPSASAAAEAWAAVKDTNLASDLEAFIEAFPDSFYARLAVTRLDALAEPKVAVGIFPEAPTVPARSTKSAGEEFTDCDACPTMVVLPAGSFLMGSPPGEENRSPDEGPQHEVTIAAPIAVGKFEVTRAQFAAFVADSGYDPVRSCHIHNNKEWINDPAKSWRDPGFPELPLSGEQQRTIQQALQSKGFDVGTPDGALGGRSRAAIADWQQSINAASTGILSDDQVRGLLNGAAIPDELSHPVVCVSWNDAAAYAEWLSKKTGFAYRLPSEAEWEYAARGQAEPNRSTRFYFGNDGDDMCRYGNGTDRTTRNTAYSWTDACSDGYFTTAPVGTFEANPFGLYDMLGNVAEWVEECFGSSYAEAPDDGSPATGSDCSQHATRGGAWNQGAHLLRSARRAHNSTDTHIFTLGFRIVRALVP